MIKLLSIYREMQKQNTYQVLYDLMKEATPEQSISHKELPTMQEHILYIDRKPQRYWYFIYAGKEIVGSIYLSKRREIGIRIFNQYQHYGFGYDAVRELKRLHPGRMLANINPKNVVSKRFFRKLKAKLLQETFEL